jgi:hypothetical protein
LWLRDGSTDSIEGGKKLSASQVDLCSLDFYLNYVYYSDLDLKRYEYVTQTTEFRLGCVLFAYLISIMTLTVLRKVVNHEVHMHI